MTTTLSSSLPNACYYRNRAGSFDPTAVPLVTPPSFLAPPRGRSESRDGSIPSSPVLRHPRNSSPRVSPSPLRLKASTPGRKQVSSFALTKIQNGSKHRRCFSLPVAPSTKYVESISLTPITLKKNPSFKDTSVSGPSLEDLISEENWKEVAERAVTCPKEAEIEMSMHVRGYRSKCLPLHWAVVRRAPKRVLLALIQAAPMALLKEESLNKYLPIHLACLYGAHVAVIEALVKACPQSVKVQDKDGNLPLHLACSRCSPDIVSIILANYQHACKICNNKEQIPLFLCVSRYDADHGIIDCLLDLYPEGATMKDSLGLTSLHLATMWRAPLAVLLSLIRENSEAVRIKDNLDRTPYLIARKLCRYDRKHAVTMALEGAMLRTNNVVLKAGSLLEIASFGMKHSSSTPRTIDGLKLRNMTYG